MGQNTLERGSALQTLQTILVAMLLGATGYLANVTLQNREDFVRLSTKFEERKQTIDEMRKLLDRTVETQQEMLQLHIKLQDADLALERRLSALESKK